MKHAVLITAYKDFEQVEHLVNQFDDNFNIYIHVDKKSNVDKRILRRIVGHANVQYINKKYSVNWGGLNHLKAYLFLCEIALNTKENEYFHLITGHDYPIKNSTYFNDLLLTNSEEKISYLEYFKMPAAIWRKDGGMGRLEYYNFYDLFNAKSPLGKKCLHYLKTFQQKLKCKRSMDMEEQLYGGSTYWTLPRNTLQFVLDFTRENPTFFRRFKYSFCAEEIYFQTVLMNSEHSKNVINDNLRFIDWENGHDGSPAFLDVSDFEKIVCSNKLFARKMNSMELKEKIIAHRK